MKKLLVVIVMTVNVFSWEVNTHRAIDRTAILYSKNLQTFLNKSGIKNSNYINERFEGYGTTYIQYILNGEKNGITEFGGSFNKKIANYQDLLEAGTILEDAQWPHWLDGGEYNYWDKGDGRFNNHFYDPQNGGHALTVGVKPNVNIVKWAHGDTYHTGVNYNYYSLGEAYTYFYKGFTENNPALRRKYQVKMLVAVGHLMHLVNDV